MAENSFTSLSKVFTQLAATEPTPPRKALMADAAFIFSRIGAWIDSHAAWTGNADRATHATGAATLTNVAESFKALIDDMRT